MSAWDDLSEAARELICERSELDIAEDYVTLSAKYDAIATELDSTRAELAALQEGEEPYEDERLVPTAGQWIWQWNRATPAERLSMAAYRLELLEIVNRCQYSEMHRARLAERWDDLMAEKQRAEQAEARIAAVRAVIDTVHQRYTIPCTHPDGLELISVGEALQRVSAALDGSATQGAAE